MYRWMKGFNPGGRHGLCGTASFYSRIGVHFFARSKTELDRRAKGAIRMKGLTLFMGLGLGLALWMAAARPIRPAETAGLTGVVSSDAEGPMEGVLVSAKRVPGTITTTVVSDTQGRFSFPVGRLVPGQYRISIRAIGYEAANPEMVATVGEGTAEADIKLNKTHDLASQLSDAEWLMSIPGTQEQKEYLFRTCSHCHTLGPILRSTYDAAGWMETFKRMRGWDQVSSITKPVASPDQGAAPFGSEEFAQYLSSINLSSRPTHDFELKTLPRPHGEDTKAIITEYDLPRRNAEPHDASPDKSGAIWYVDFADGILGRLIPATGEVREWQDPASKPGYPSGFQSLDWDSQGNAWVGRHDWNSIAKFDVKTEKFIDFNLPSGSKSDFVSVGGDGKIWVKDSSSNSVDRVDPVTGESTRFDGFPAQMMAKDYSGPRHHIYGITADAKGNVYEADIDGGDLFRVDGATGKASMYAIPTKDAGPRRMHMGEDGRLWIGEYYGKTIGMFDPKEEKFQEWKIPVPWYGAYDVAPDKDGYAWTGTMTSEIILRLNPKTGEFRKYLLPRLGVNVRRVDVDNSGAHPVFWVGENHQAKIAKVEPLN
jgi:streptogramin lyase